MLVSQRPSEFDQTILSQCGTLFAMRLANDTDRAHVAGPTSDKLKGLLDMLPVLRTGEAIVVGEAVALPVRTLIDPPANNRRPDSSDPSDFAIVTRLCRKQNPRYAHQAASEPPDTAGEEKGP